MSQLVGRRIVVTGAASGMGAAVVGAYLDEGARVAAIDVTETVTGSDGAAPPESRLGCVCDVSNAEQVRTTFDHIVVDQFGGLDVLVHAAGVETKAKAEDVTEADWNLMLDVNAKGTMFTNQAAFRAMRESGGAILNFASAAGVKGYATGAHYAASKGAVLSWTRSIAMEWGRYGITANAICPGIWTPMYERARAAFTTPEELAQHDEWVRLMTPIGGKLGDAATDLVPIMVFLATPGAHYFTGQTFGIDGGRTMLR